MLTTAMILLVSHLAPITQDCEVVAPGQPTGISILKKEEGAKVFVGGGEVTKLPYKLKRGDQVRSQGNVLLYAGPDGYDSFVWMRTAQATIVGETESVDKLPTWDICPESGSFFVDEDPAQMEMARKHSMMGGFLRPFAKMILVQPVAFRRRSVRLYSVGTQYLLTVQKTGSDLRWNINLTEGSLAFERDGSEVYRQTARIKFSAVVNTGEVSFFGAKSMTRAEIATLGKGLGKRVGQRIRVGVPPEVSVKIATGLLINGAAAKPGLIKAGSRITATGPGGEIIFAPDHTVRFMTGFDGRYCGFDTKKAPNMYDLKITGDAGGIHISNRGFIRTRPRPLTWPVQWRRRSVRLYSSYTNFSIHVSMFTLSLHVIKDQVEGYLDLISIGPFFPRTTPYTILVPSN